MASSSERYLVCRPAYGHVVEKGILYLQLLQLRTASTNGGCWVEAQSQAIREGASMI